MSGGDDGSEDSESEQEQDGYEADFVQATQAVLPQVR